MSATHSSLSSHPADCTSSIASAILAKSMAMSERLIDNIRKHRRRMLEEEDPAKLESLKKNVEILFDIYISVEDDIALTKARISEEGKSHANTPQLASAKVTKPTVSAASIPPFRLLHDGSFYVKYIDADKVRPEEVDSNKEFETIHDFLHKFETTLQNYSVDMDKQWFKYLEVSINNGQNPKSISWLTHKANQAEFKSSTWQAVRDMLVVKFGESFSHQEYKEKLMRCRQRNGEHLHLYVSRYINLLTKAKLKDDGFLVSLFLQSLYEPVRTCVVKRLSAIRTENYSWMDDDYILVGGTLANLQSIFEKEKAYFTSELDKLFLLMKKEKRSRSLVSQPDTDPFSSESNKRKLPHNDQHRSYSKKPRDEGKHPTYLSPRSNDCRHCGLAFSPGHLDVCKEYYKHGNVI